MPTDPCGHRAPRGGLGRRSGRAVRVDERGRRRGLRRTQRVACHALRGPAPECSADPSPSLVVGQRGAERWTCRRGAERRGGCPCPRGRPVALPWRRAHRAPASRPPLRPPRRPRDRPSAYPCSPRAIAAGAGSAGPARALPPRASGRRSSGRPRPRRRRDRLHRFASLF